MRSRIERGDYMTEFPELREALHAWAQEAVVTLRADSDAAYEGVGVPEWACDADGVFRNIARPMDGWDFHKLRQLQELTSWPVVEKAFHRDARLNRQIDTLV